MKGNDSISLIQITDTHILDDREQEFYGFNTSKSLEAVIEKINQENAELIVITGDLVQEPTQAAYETFLDITKNIKAPCYCLPGNHDNPEMMKKLFADTHMQFTDSVSVKVWQVIFLNSHKANTHAGYLIPQELEKLKQSLKNNSHKHNLLALHHHPVSIASTWMDGMTLENAEEFNNIIKSENTIRGVIWGHIHQDFERQEKGVSYMGSPSTCIQFKPRAKEYTQDSLPPGYRKIELNLDGSIDSEVIFLEAY